MTDAQNPKMNPWVPMKNPLDLKHLGKLAEELNECAAAVSRCIIQGIMEKEPVTQKLNKEWLEDEIADVYANIWVVSDHFKLDMGRIFERQQRKITNLQIWHAMLEGK